MYTAFLSNVCSPRLLLTLHYITKYTLYRLHVHLPLSLYLLPPSIHPIHSYFLILLPSSLIPILSQIPTFKVAPDPAVPLHFDRLQPEFLPPPWPGQCHATCSCTKPELVYPYHTLGPAMAPSYYPSSSGCMTKSYTCSLLPSDLADSPPNTPFPVSTASACLTSFIFNILVTMTVGQITKCAEFE